MLCCPHLVLTNVSYINRMLAFKAAAQLLHHPRSCQAVASQQAAILCCIPGLNLLPPIGVCCLLHQRQQALQCLLYITHYGKACCYIFIYFRRVDIKLDNRLLSYVTVAVTGYAVAETAAGYYQHISLRYSHVGSDMTMHTGHAQGAFVRLRINADAHQRIYYRQISLLGQLQQLILRTAVNSAATNQQYRTLCLVQHCRCLLQLLRCCLWQLFCCRSCLRLAPFQLLNLYAAGNIHQHRSRSALLCQGKCLAQCRKQLFFAAYQHVVFGNRHCNADNINLLEGITSQHAYANLTGNRYQRNGIKISSCQAGNNVCSTGTGCCDTYAGSAARTGIAVSCMNSTLLMCGQHIFKRCIVQGIIQRNHSTSGITEDCIYALLQKDLYNGF